MTKRTDHIGECEEHEGYWLWQCVCEEENKLPVASLVKGNHRFYTEEPVPERILVEALERLGYTVTPPKEKTHGTP